MLVGRVGELLPHVIGTVSSEEWCNSGLSFGVRPFHILQIVVLVTVGSIVRERSVGAKAILVDIESHILGKDTVTAHAGVARCAHQLLGGLVGDDVDHTGDGIRAIKRRCGTIEYLNALHTLHVDAVEINIT